MRSDLSQATAVELVAAMTRRELGVVELLESCLRTVARLNPRLNAFVTVAEESARAAAQACQSVLDRGEPAGLLHGLPFGVKDIVVTAGIRTTYGSPLYKDHVPTEDAEVVARLKRAGAIVLGKTNTPEFATGANTVNEVFGATRNPWNTELSPAGSSGGSAVAVAAGMVPLAQGTDFGCSIRIPAAFCGIVGLRTTAGLIPNRPMHLPWDPGQVHGPMARTAEDAALMLDAMIGLDPLWPISVAPPWRSALAEVQASAGASGLRIAYAPDIAGFGVDAEVEAICRQAAVDLRQAGAQVDEIEFDAADGFDAYKTLRGQWMVGQQLQRMAMLPQFGPNLRGNVEAGLALTVADTAAAEHARERVWARFRDLFERYDFLLTPAAPVLPYPVSENYPAQIGGRRLDHYIDWIAPAFLVTLVGFPAGSVPAGKSASGLPVGLQVVGRRFAEPGILSLAKLVQSQHPIGRPPVD